LKSFVYIHALGAAFSAPRALENIVCTFEPFEGGIFRAAGAQNAAPKPSLGGTIAPIAHP